MNHNDEDNDVNIFDEDHGCDSFDICAFEVDVKGVRVKQFIPFTRDKDRRVFWIG